MRGSPGRSQAVTVPPPSRHESALMIWLAVFPTLSLLNVTVGSWLGGLPVVERTFVLATVAVPVVVYGLMPVLLRARVRRLTRGTPPSTVTTR